MDANAGQVIGAGNAGRPLPQRTRDARSRITAGSATTGAGTYLDVLFNSAGAVAIDPATITLFEASKPSISVRI